MGRSPGEGNSCPLHYSGLENYMDSTVHGVAKSQTQLRGFHFTLVSPSTGSSSTLLWNFVTTAVGNTHTHTHTRTCTFHIPLDQVTLPMGTCQKASRSARGPSPHSSLGKPPSPWPAHFSGAVAAENYPGRWAASLNTAHSVSPATFKIPLCQRRRK